MKNFITGNDYSGSNLNTLAEAGYTENNQMLTFKQAMRFFQITGDMLKGLKGLGTTLCFYKEQINKETGKKFKLFARELSEAGIELRNFQTKQAELVKTNIENESKNKEA